MSGSEDVHPVSAEDDSLLALVQRIDPGLVWAAYEGLRERTYARYHRLEQFGAGGDLLAFEEVLAFNARDSLHVVREDSFGTFDFGFLRPFVPEGGEPVRPSELPGYVLPDDPSYASARNRQSYAYELIPDTTLQGQRVRTVRITALPGEGDGQSIRRADLYVDTRTDRLVAVYLERADSAVWFREVTTLFLSVRQLPGGAWVPAHSRFETLIKLPFRPAQRFRNVYSYFGYEAG